MNKYQRSNHTQKLINHYNHKLEQTERMIASNNFTLIGNRLVAQQRHFIKKLMKLYATEKYGLV